MTQTKEDRLGRLREAVVGLPSGSRLIAALEAKNSVAAPIDLIIAVVNEAKGQKSAIETAAPTRVDLGQSSSLIPQLQFLTPR